MGTDIIEVVAGNELSHECVVGPSESLTAVLTHRVLTKVSLIAQPSCCTSVGDSRIDLEVKTLFGCIIAHMG